MSYNDLTEARIQAAIAAKKWLESSAYSKDKKQEVRIKAIAAKKWLETAYSTDKKIIEARIKAAIAAKKWLETAYSTDKKLIEARIKAAKKWFESSQRQSTNNYYLSKIEKI